MGQNRLKSTEFTGYKEALARWRGEKPKNKAYYRATYASGFALGSDKANEAEAKHDKDVEAWKAREPKRSDFENGAPKSVDAPPSNEVKTTIIEAPRNNIEEKESPKVSTPSYKTLDDPLSKSIDSYTKFKGTSNGATTRNALEKEKEKKKKKFKFSGSGPRTIMRGKSAFRRK